MSDRDDGDGKHDGVGADEDIEKEQISDEIYLDFVSSFNQFVRGEGSFNHKISSRNDRREKGVRNLRKGFHQRRAHWTLIEVPKFIQSKTRVSMEHKRAA